MRRIAFIGLVLGGVACFTACGAETTGATGSGGSTAQGAAIGDACKSDADCAAGDFCSTTDPGGQCEKACKTQSDCPSGSTCTDELKCYKACTTAADCTRTGYTCVDSMPSKTCDVAP